MLRFRGELLAELLAQNEMTQQELGNRLGVSHQLISGWVNQRSKPNKAMRAKLCAIFGVKNADWWEEIPATARRAIPQPRGRAVYA